MKYIRAQNENRQFNNVKSDYTTAEQEEVKIRWSGKETVGL